MASSSAVATVLEQDAVQTRGSRGAIYAMFAVDGVGFGVWASFLPAFKASLGVSDGGLSIPLFAMVVGSLLSMPAAGRVMARRGSRGVVLASGAAYSGILPLIALAAVAPGGLPLFTLAALAFGASKGALDVSANAQAIAVERGGGRPIVASCHGCWSLGLLCGSVLAGVALRLGVPPLAAALVAGLALLVWSVAASNRLGTDDRPESGAEGRATLWPRGRLLSLAVLAFFALFCEGAMGDWGAVYLAGEVGVSASSAAFGYSAYATAMTAGRFAGDRLVARLGAAALLRSSALLVAAGLGAALLLRTYPAALGGFALVGVGLANMIPVIYRSAGRDHGAGGAIASVATVGSLGFLIGPPVIGALSRAAGLSRALGVVVAFAVMIAACARFAAERGRERPDVSNAEGN